MAATQTVTRRQHTKTQTTLTKPSKVQKPPTNPAPKPKSSFKPTQEIQHQLDRIARSTRSPFEKHVYATLCQVPRGQFTTYGAMAAHLGSSPRAIGNAMRRNPFAPGVPCHRVVATGGTLGGFKGQWVKSVKEGKGRLGITLDEKVGLLKAEGVKFAPDGRKVVGSPFTGFV
ncbi:hypothetical protein jhhlp_005600 [Lomentospora prolificans]|uniref:Methylated-DNA--protein-cysteine methyltransferase n=1 Tax=Lomentospora prolificans TaxID=41688 RepID=A0A2N3N3K0_9PEZI|nr:hypothetical protein jhhlp_005600 [Lomentospora prolificans]